MRTDYTITELTPDLVDRIEAVLTGDDPIEIRVEEPRPRYCGNLGVSGAFSWPFPASAWASSIMARAIP